MTSLISTQAYTRRNIELHEDEREDERNGIEWRVNLRIITVRMKGLLLEEYNEAYVYHEDIAVPELQPGMLLIRVKAVGFCHTDLMVMSGEYPATLPIVPGHETVGMVAAVAEGVTGFKVGDRVGTLLFRGGCGECRECIHLTPEYCSQIQLAGLDSHGGMAQYLLSDPSWTIHLPESMGFIKAAPLMCAGATVYHSLLRCGVSPGPSMSGSSGDVDGGKGRGLVGIIGIGGLGHLGVQFAKALGYNVVAIDTRSAPLELCQSLPEHLRPDMTFNPNEMTVPEMLKGIETSFKEVVYQPTSEWPEDSPALEDSHQPTASKSKSPQHTTLPATGLDAVLVCTDSIEGYATGIELLAKHGMLVYVGQPKKPVPMHWSAFVTRDIHVVAGCLPCGRWSDADVVGGCGSGENGERREGRKWTTAKDVLRDMVELVERVGIHVEVSEYQLEDVGAMLREFGGDGMKGKVVLRIGDD